MKNEITVVFFGFQVRFGKSSHCLILFPLPHIHTPCGCKVTLQPVVVSYFSTTVVKCYFYYILDRYWSLSQMRYFTDNFLIITGKGEIF
jgi:hypothetical protein